MDSNQSMQPPPPSYDQATSSSSTQPPVASTYDKQNVQAAVPLILPTIYTTPTPTPLMTTTTITTTHSTTPRTILLRNGIAVGPGNPIVGYVPFGPEPFYMTCPSCHVRQLTRVEYEPDIRTHLMAGILCLLGLFCCSCLPYCMESCMNAVHHCGNCNAYLGCYKHN